MKRIAIIPARMGSTRFPGKPLASINGKPMIQRVYEAAQGAGCFGGVYVATPDQEIRKTVEGFGGDCIATRGDFPTGSDRVASAARTRNIDRNCLIVNVQGDYPYIPSRAVAMLCYAMELTKAKICTLVRPLDAEDMGNLNVVKANVNALEYAVDFARQAFKHPCDGMLPAYEHIGVYAFRNEYLQHFAEMPQSPREKEESLEQLRIIENGERIMAVAINEKVQSVNTPGDLEVLSAC